MRTGYLYRLEFPNGKSYVGITCKTPQERFARHKRSIHSRDHLLYRAWRKYGDPRIFVIARNIPVDDLKLLEIKAIRRLNTFTPWGYNSTIGGEFSEVADYVKKKIGDKNRGRKQSPEQIEKLRAKRLGRKLSDSAKEKVRVASTGRKHSSETIEKMRNRFFTPEHRARISASKTGVPKSETEKIRLRSYLVGRVMSDEHKAKLHGPETRAKCSATRAKNKILREQNA